MTNYEKIMGDMTMSKLAELLTSSECKDCAQKVTCKSNVYCNDRIEKHLFKEYKPKKTRKDLFFEMFPNARKDHLGYPLLCVDVIDNDFMCSNGCEECTKNYWDKEIEESE